MGRPRRHLHKDFWGGSLIVLLGIVVVLQGRSYDTGALSRMGPGYFPVALGVILVLCGVVIAINGYVASPPADTRQAPSEWRAWFLICLSIVAFIISAQYLGLVPATFAIVFISALADRGNTWKG